jgi:hypothetical protein
VISPDQANVAAPVVTATLRLNGKTQTINLTGPAVLPRAFNAALGQVQHSASDSFMATIPAAWVSPGLAITVNLPASRLDIPSIAVGAPTELVWNMVDIHLLGDQYPGDFIPGWKEEIEAKLPVAKLTLRRFKSVAFPEVAINGYLGGRPAVRVRKLEDYQAATGVTLVNAPIIAQSVLNMTEAIRDAGGRKGRTGITHTNFYGINSVGIGGNFMAVQPARYDTTNGLFHELGHTLSLPHWGEPSYAPTYPYKGAMYGIAAPNTLSSVHVGPVWAFDSRSSTFIPPTVQPNNVGGSINGQPVVVGSYKADPMQGGGWGDQETGYIFRHFSDYSALKMREYLERQVVVWNSALGSYASWNQADGAYTRAVTNNGVDYPIERDVDVITVMAAVVPQNLPVNLAYPPIGPHRAGLTRRFDPSNAVDRQDAAKIFCPVDGCDVSLRVTQGGVTKTYMLDASWVTIYLVQEAKHRAINLRAADGPVTRVQLLYTPDAQASGLPDAPTVLDEWVAPAGGQ